MNKKIKKKIICAFIFARKGSKGIKNKNIKKIRNKKLFEYGIEFAKTLKISDVIVSSNIPQIQSYCKKKKIFFIKRPNKLASSTSAEILSWKHAILEYENIIKKKIDIFISLPIVSPLKSIFNVNKALKIINNKNVDAVISVVRSDVIPNFNLFRKKKNRLLPFKNMKKTFRRQSSYVNLVVPNFYVCKRNYVLSTKHIFEGNIYPFEIGKEYSMDINDSFDFKITQSLILKN